MTKAIIIDDSFVNREGLLHLIELHCPQIRVIGMAESVKKGAALIDAEQPNIVFLDIELGDGTGFQLLEKTAFQDYNVIFVTAFETYAVDAFRTKASAYILKPVQISDLVNAVDKTIALSNDRDDMQIQDNDTAPEVIAISTQNELLFVKTQDIVRCEAEGKFTKCLVKDRTIMASKNLKEFELVLTSPQFIRIHHSHLVNTQKIVSYNRAKSYITLANSDIIPVSQRKREIISNTIRTI